MTLRSEQRDAESDHGVILAGSQNESAQAAHVGQIPMRKVASIALTRKIETLPELRLREHGGSSALSTRSLQCSDLKALFSGQCNYSERSLYGGSCGYISSTLSGAATLEVSISAVDFSPRSVRTSSGALSLLQPIF